MAELSTHNPEFDIDVSIQGTSKTIHVKPDETSDGVEYYICFEGDEQISQIRLEGKDTWAQLWGDLSDMEVQELGKAITNHK